MKFYLYEIKYRIGEYLNNGDAQLFYHVPPDCDIHATPRHVHISTWSTFSRQPRGYDLCFQIRVLPLYAPSQTQHTANRAVAEDDGQDDGQDGGRDSVQDDAQDGAQDGAQDDAYDDAYDDTHDDAEDGPLFRRAMLFNAGRRSKRKHKFTILLGHLMHGYYGVVCNQHP